MTLNEYQHEALLTASYASQFSVIQSALGITGEADECADKVILCDTQIVNKVDTEAIMFSPKQRHAIALKIGDVLRYCAALARDIDMSLEEVAELNISKNNSHK